jgi:hypothetical protein
MRAACRTGPDEQLTRSRLIEQRHASDLCRRQQRGDLGDLARQAKAHSVGLPPQASKIRGDYAAPDWINRADAVGALRDIPSTSSRATTLCQGGETVSILPAAGKRPLDTKWSGSARSTGCHEDPSVKGRHMRVGLIFEVPGKARLMDSRSGRGRSRRTGRRSGGRPARPSFQLREGMVTRRFGCSGSLGAAPVLTPSLGSLRRGTGWPSQTTSSSGDASARASRCRWRPHDLRDH